jgi:hypothetical protein
MGLLGWEVTHGFSDDFEAWERRFWVGIGNGAGEMEVTTFASLFLLLIAWSDNEIGYLGLLWVWKICNSFWSNRSSPIERMNPSGCFHLAFCLSYPGDLLFGPQDCI